MNTYAVVDGSHVLTEEEVRIAAQALREFAEEEMQQ